MQQIVIVEDDRGLSVGLGKALRGEGRTVCECYSLREARQQLALGDPALVLLDVGLPDGIGLELLLPPGECPAAPERPGGEKRGLYEPPLLL